MAVHVCKPQILMHPATFPTQAGNGAFERWDARHRKRHTLTCQLQRQVHGHQPQPTAVGRTVTTRSACCLACGVRLAPLWHIKPMATQALDQLHSSLCTRRLAKSGMQRRFAGGQLYQDAVAVEPKPRPSKRMGRLSTRCAASLTGHSIQKPKDGLPGLHLTSQSLQGAVEGRRSSPSSLCKRASVINPNSWNYEITLRMATTESVRAASDGFQHGLTGRVIAGTNSVDPQLHGPGMLLCDHPQDLAKRLGKVLRECPRDRVSGNITTTNRKT